MTMTWQCPDCSENNVEPIQLTAHGLTNAHRYLACRECDSRLNVQVVALHTPPPRTSRTARETVLR